MNGNWRFGSAAMVVAGLTGFAQAEEVTETVILNESNAQDTFLYNNAPDMNFGESGLFWYDERGANNDSARPVIQFDLPSLPSWAVITGATLNLKVQQQLYVDANNNDEPVPHDFSVHRMLSGWEEMEASWNSASDGVPWNTPGLGAESDYDSTALDTVTIGKEMEGSYVGWDITSLLADWYAGEADNHGVTIRGPEGVPDFTAAEGDTTDGLLRLYNTEFDNDDFRPFLEVTYVPEPGTLGLLSAAGLAMLCRRRRDDGQTTG